MGDLLATSVGGIGMHTPLLVMCVPLISVYCPYHHYAFYESTKLWYSIHIVYRSLFIIYLVVFL